jgi:hypothetical protein
MSIMAVFRPTSFFEQMTRCGVFTWTPENTSLQQLY